MRVLAALALLFSLTAHADEAACSIPQGEYDGYLREKPYPGIEKIIASAKQRLDHCRTAAVRDAAKQHAAEQQLEAYRQRDREREAARHQAEEQRAAEETVTVQAAAETSNKIRANATMMRMVLSAQVCAYQEWRGRTVAEIGKQKHYSAIGGAVDLRVMMTLQRRLRALDEFIGADRTELKKRKLKAFSCGSDEVNALFSCDGGADWPECQQDPMPMLVGMLDEHDDEIPGAELFSENY